MTAVEIERHGRVAVLCLNQPENNNALSGEVKDEIAVHIPALMADNSVGSIVITGRGNVFCAGGDVRGFESCSAQDMFRRIRSAHVWAKQILNGDKPIIAAVNGAAAGAGFSLALLCDFILVSDRAFFRAGFVGIGAAPDLGIAYTLPRLVGMQRAKELLVTNRRIDAAEAVGLGIALRSVEHAVLFDDALAFAEKLAHGPPLSLSLTKALVNDAFAAPLDAFLNKEAMAQTIVFGGSELAEGVCAFLEKRKPNFHGT